MSRDLAEKREILPEMETFEQAFDQYAPQIYRHALARTGHKETAQDIASDVFLKAWEYVQKKQDPVENFRAFLYRIAHNLITDHYRKKKKDTIELDAISVSMHASIIAPSAHHQYEERELVAMVEAAMRQLDADHRDMLVWRYIDELSIEEIVLICGKTPNNVYVIMHRAIKKLRIILEKRGL
ncbi:MAG: sigma-70 family RNA polymerase sigma factor [bacterium]|nr:sigma-70 family RNA polymerase sigma factor [bacterium]